MKNALAKRDEGGGRFDEPMERLMVKVDEGTFARLQSAGTVRMRVFCPQNGASLNFMLKSMGRGGDSWMTLDLNLDERMFFGIINPKLKVTFQCQNVIAPFGAVGMSRGSVFCENPPLTDPVN